ncbi:MAG: PilZ domain-containing protein [Opitutae bacterium]|nr:PilZ domain-containing protein [Opitutae bacterium]
MSFFRSILDFKRDTVNQREQRLSQRYNVGAGFPLQATLILLGPGGKPRELAGVITDLSITGANVQLAPDVTAMRGERCSLRLVLGPHNLVIDGTVAHFRAGPPHASCGLALRFDEFNTQKAYQQLFETVVLGASLTPAPAELVRQDAPGEHKEQYRGDEEAQLTVWRAAPGGAINGFEFRMLNYFARGNKLRPVLEVYSQEEVKDEHKAHYPAPALHSLRERSNEIQQLYAWTVPNLAPVIPADVRAFLGKFAR